MFIYECGCLTALYKQNKFSIATEWRDKLDLFSKDNGIQTFNPAITYLNERNHDYNPRLCVDQNRYYLDKADILVAQLDYIHLSPGSIWELTYACEKKNIPVIAFGEETSWSPHIMNCVSTMCKDIDEVIEILTNMFSQSFK